MSKRAVSITPPPSDSRAERPEGALLGPQRLGITIGRELAAFGATGDVAAITAGWQEREAEDEELNEAIGSRSINLMLHRRCEELFEADNELFRAHRTKQDLIRKLQTFHRIRLDYAVQGTRELLAASAEDTLGAMEVESAFDHLRQLDNHHVRQLDEIQRQYEEELKPGLRPEVQRHREELRELIDGCDAVAIAGGHVALLLNRLRLFDVGEMLRSKPLFAWSAGAMAVCERVVVFHDHPPQGRGNAEVIASGLGIFKGIVVFPHAKRRLALDSPERVMLLSRRFGPAQSVTLDEYSGIRYRKTKKNGALASAFGPAKLLGLDGEVVEIDPTYDAGAE